MSTTDAYDVLRSGKSNESTPNTKETSGTQNDLRKLTMKQMTSILRSYGVAYKQIAVLKRWDRVHVIRELTTKAASDGMGDELERFGASNDGSNECVKLQAPIVVDAEKNVRVLSHVLFGYGKIVSGTVGGRPRPENVAAAASVPYDPISDEWELSTPLEREAAWLAEESHLLMPSDGTMDDPTRLPLVLDFAWAHGSPQLREGLMANHPSEVNSMLKTRKHTSDHSNAVRDGSLVVVDACIFLSRGNLDGIFHRLRGGARDALRLGYRRSESIEIALGTRPSTTKSTRKVPLRYQRRPISRLKNGDIVVGGALPDTMKPADGMMTSSLFDAAKTTNEMDVVASSVPSELRELEEEVAWLVEESLIFMPQCTTSTEKDPPEQSKAVISSGPTQPSEVDWPYVRRHASVPLGELMERVGDRRPLQRIVRSHDKDVRVSFSKRRDEIFRLLLGGYRRFKTQHDLPNHERLVHSGMAHILEVRRARYRHFGGGSAQEPESVGSACKLRLTDMTNSPRKRKFKREKQFTISHTMSKLPRC